MLGSRSLAGRIFVLLSLLLTAREAAAGEVRGLDRFDADLDAFVEVLGHPEEARIFAGLQTTEERERFLHGFWAARGVADPATSGDSLVDATADDPAAAAADAAFERARRLHLRFLEARTRFDDLRTHRARAYLLAGAPARIVAFGGCRGIIRPLRLWWYDRHQARDLGGEASAGEGFWLVFRRDYSHDPGLFRTWWPGDEITGLSEDDAPFPRSTVEQILDVSRTNRCFRKGESEAEVVEEALRNAWPLSRLERMARSPAADRFAHELSAETMGSVSTGSVSTGSVSDGDLVFHDGVRLHLGAAGRAAGGARPETAVRLRFEVPASLLRRVRIEGLGAAEGEVFDRWTVHGEVRDGLRVVDSFAHVFHVLGTAEDGTSEDAVLDAWRRVRVGAHTLELRLEDATGRALLRAERYVDVPRRTEPARVPEEHRLGLAGLSRDRVMTLVGTTPRAASAAAAPAVGPRPAGVALEVADGAAEVRFRAPAGPVGPLSPGVPKLERLEIYVDDRRVRSFAPSDAAEAGVYRVDLGDAIHPLTTFVRASALLDDGSRVEDHVFLRGQGVDALDVRLVEIYATVLDRRDHPVVGLRADDLRLREEGEVQELERFDRVENLPLRVGLLMDTSTSMRERLPVAVASARRFFATVVRPGDRATLLTFDHELRLQTPWTGDVSRLALGAAGLEAEGGTRLHDAVVWALGAFAFHEPGRPGQSPARRALVILSDGADVSSDTPFERALENAVEAGVAVYPILLPGGRRERSRSGAHSGGGALVRLARESGGRAFSIDDVEDLDWVYERIEQELRSQYLLVYASPGQPDGRFREIIVEVLRKGLEARAVRGYWR